MGCLTSGKKYFGIVYGVPEIKILEMIRVEEENNGMQLVIAWLILGIGFFEAEFRQRNMV